MQLEAGKYYRTRDGRKALVGAVEPPFVVVEPNHRAIGWVDGECGSSGWTTSGEFVGQGAASPLDLMEEWREPERATVWFYRFNGRIYGYPLRLRGFDKEKFAIAEITEGYGL